MNEQNLDPATRSRAAGGTNRPLGLAMMILTQEANQVTGTATYVRALLEAFQAMPGEIDVQLFASALAAHQLLSPTERSSPVSSGSSKGRRGLGLARLALRPQLTMRRSRFSPSVAHYPLTLAVPRTVLPSIVTLHDLQHRDLPENFSSAQLLWRKLMYDDAARRADHVITVSEHARGRLIDVLGLDPDCVHAIHHGLDHQLFVPDGTPADHDIVKSLTLPARFFIYPAGLWPHKNHERAIAAFAELRDPDLELLFTGPTFGRLDRLMDYARARGVGDRVRHLGFVSDRMLPVLYRHARALVFPSLYEGFGAPPLEAMACGCPVAAADQGSVAEVCADAAVSFDPHDTEDMTQAFRLVLSDEPERQRLRSAGLRRAQEFSWTIAASKHLDVYHVAAA